jgi:hypothetical protein
LKGSVWQNTVSLVRCFHGAKARAPNSFINSLQERGFLWTCQELDSFDRLMFSKGLELCFWHSILSLVCGLNGKFLFRWTRCEDRKGSGKDFLKNPWQSYRPFQVGKVITPNQPWTHLGSCSIGTHPSVSMGNLDARKSCGGKLGRVSFVQRPFQGIRENGRKNYMSFKHIMMVWNTHLTWQPWSRSFHFGLQFRIWGAHSETRLVLVTGSLEI